MQLTFLQGQRPLTKKYTKTQRGYDRESYTDVFKVTSHSEEVNGIDAFAAALAAHAGHGHCLHTGPLDRALQEESRKGHHLKDEPRDWIVLDLDDLGGFVGAEDFITTALPEEFHSVSYIEQHSPSSGIKPNLNMHLFFLLDRAEHMKDIRTWVMHMNLATESLRNRVTLAPSNFALSYPLDRIANDNGRLIYIAPPECVGFADPVAERIRVVEKDHEFLRYNFAKSIVSDVKALERKHVDKLRDDKGLPKKRAREYYEMRGDVEVLKKTLTEPGRVRPVQQDNEFIIRCNLDDGDSEAYFYYVKYPALLRNHKGEPALFMEMVDNEYYTKIAEPGAKGAWEKDKQAFVFRNQTDDKYFVGLRVGEDIITQPHVIGSEAKIEDYFQQHGGMGVPDPIPTWEQRFDPTLEQQWNASDLVFNTWRKTELMANAMPRLNPPATIDRIVRHVVGGEDAEYEHFMNWLAYVFQRRTKTGTAWLFHGIQGTGKGLLIDFILAPIFGEDYVYKQQSRNLKAEFNGFLEKALIVNLDEFDINDAGNDASQVMQALKMWITDKTLPVRAMYRESAQMRNYSNFIMTTNSQNGMPVQEGDRRISMGLRQEERLTITPEEVEGIEGELEHFAGYLVGYKVDATRAHTCLENQAKQRALELSKNSVEQFVDALRYGDLEYFTALVHEHSRDPMLKSMVTQIIETWIQDAKNDQPSSVPATDLAQVYTLACNDRGMKTGKFKSMMSHKLLPAERIRAQGGRPWGWKVTWDLDEQARADLKLHLKVVPTTEELEQKLKDEIGTSPTE